MCNDLVYLGGIGGDRVECKSQIFGVVAIDKIGIPLLFHIVPDSSITLPAIIGRDILENGVSVNIDGDDLSFNYGKYTNICNLER